ncbi:MAG: dephospho-CoA kinase [Lachnospiraceae bacterium]|nr:dephospho-CoA kinase [Lachnospiraceae bacterium]
MIIGITGGVGCGKSTVLNYFKDKYKAYIIEADKVAYDLSLPGNPGYDSILRFFPEVKLMDNGFIDRKHLASIVFNDESKLKLLNSIIHPLVKEKITELIIENRENRYIIIEAALLIEDGYDNICDEIWYIYCDLETRIERLNKSRNYSREKSLEIINNQMSEEDYKKHTDYIIDNSFDQESTHNKIDELLSKRQFD